MFVYIILFIIIDIVSIIDQAVEPSEDSQENSGDANTNPRLKKVTIKEPLK